MGFASQQTRNPIPRKIIFLFFKLDQEHPKWCQSMILQFAYSQRHKKELINSLEFKQLLSSK